MSQNQASSCGFHMRSTHFELNDVSLYKGFWYFDFTLALDTVLKPKCLALIQTDMKAYLYLL